MGLKSVKIHLVFGILLLALFLSLMAVRTGLFNMPGGGNIQAGSYEGVRLKDSDLWMDVLHNGRKVGYSHSRLLGREGGGYNVEEEMLLRLVTMGVPGDINMKGSAVLRDDLTVDRFALFVESGAFEFSAEGVVSDDIVRLKTTTGGNTHTSEFPVKERPYISLGVFNAVSGLGLAPGQSVTLRVFDPFIMASVPFVVTVVGKENIEVEGRSLAATLVTMEAKGMRQYAWIDENGDVLKESGPMGMTMVRTTRSRALAGNLQSAQDLTELASISSNIKLPDPRGTRMLKVLISGMPHDYLEGLSGGRQTFSEGVLTITRESVEELGCIHIGAGYEQWLGSGPFIQSDDPKIREVAESVVHGKNCPLEKASSLVGWVHKNLAKKPVLSLPNALATLQNRQGDCNEHAVLLAALARATGIPAKVETGLVYLNGRFFYHAWNSLYVGRWLTADAVFGQIPADATHIRLAEGIGEDLFDIVSTIGKVNIEIVGHKP